MDGHGHGHGYSPASFMAGYGLAEATVYGSVRAGAPKYVRVGVESLGRADGRLEVRDADTDVGEEEEGGSGSAEVVLASLGAQAQRGGRNGGGCGRG